MEYRLITPWRKSIASAILPECWRASARSRSSMTSARRRVTSRSRLSAYSSNKRYHPRTDRSSLIDVAKSRQSCAATKSRPALISSAACELIS